VVERGDIIWAELGPPSRRRPVCVLTCDAAIAVLTAITCAPITRTIRGIRSEAEIGPAQGLPNQCVISCDNLITIPTTLLDAEPVGRLDLETRIRLDQALRYALDIQY
jgi:mRNA interferase MazF